MVKHNIGRKHTGKIDKQSEKLANDTELIKATDWRSAMGVKDSRLVLALKPSGEYVSWVECKEELHGHPNYYVYGHYYGNDRRYALIQYNKRAKNFLANN